MTIKPAEGYIKVEPVLPSEVGHTVNPPYAFFRITDYNKSRYHSGDIVVAMGNQVACLQGISGEIESRAKALFLPEESVVCQVLPASK
jgi:hypothetical protein